MPAVEVEIAIVGVTLLASAVQTVAGFGFSLLAVPILSLLIDPAEAVVVSALLSFLNVMRVSHASRADTPWRTVGFLLVGSVLGLPLGVQVLLFASPEALRLLVGLVAAVMAVAIGLGLRWAGSGPSSLLTGFVSGILATSTAINGPPIVLYLQATSLGPAAFRAAMSNLLVLNGIFSTTGFVVAGVLAWPQVEAAAFGVPSLFAGYWLGSWLLERLDPGRFRRFVLWLLAAVGSLTAGIALYRLL